MAEGGNDLMTGYLMGATDNGGGNGGGNGGFGNGWGDLAALLIIAGLFGWGGRGGGFGGFGGGGSGGDGGCATRSDLASSFSFNNLDNAVRGISQGICDSTYALNNSIMSGFHGVDNAICNLGFNIQQGFNTLGYQQKDCCCETQRLIERGFCDVGYAMATNTANIVQAGHNDTDRVIAKLDAMENARMLEKIDALRTENQTLKFAASQSAQNAFITANQEAQTAEIIRRLGRDCPVPAYVVPNPNCCYGNPVGVSYGGNGCGCGCG
jgi:hypothetical protein